MTRIAVLQTTTGIDPAKLHIHFAAIGGDFGGKGGQMNVPIAYFLSKKAGRPVRMVLDYVEELGAANPRQLSGPDTLSTIVEDPRMSTNGAAQTGLTTIQILELCKDALPHDAPERIGPPPRRR